MKPILLLSALAISLSVTAQDSIRFEKGSWKEIIALSKKEKKMIFLDAYASWCRPCKWMEKNTFKNDTAASFFNANFVNAKIDMEKGEGEVLAARYQVSAYPTMLFIDSSGAVMHRIAGARNATQLVEDAKTAQHPGKRYRMWREEYQKGNRDPKFIAGYMDQLYEAAMDVSEVANWYFATTSEKDLVTEEGFEVIEKHLNTTQSPAFKFLIANKSKFYTLADSGRVNNKIEQLYSSLVRSALGKGKIDEEKFKAAIDELKTSGSGEQTAWVYSQYYKQKSDWANYMKYSAQYLAYQWSSQDALNEYAWSVYELPIADKEHLKTAVTWAKRSVELAEEYYNSDTYAAVLYKSGNKKEALKAAERAVELAKKNGEDYRTTSELIEKIKKELGQ